MLSESMIKQGGSRFGGVAAFFLLLPFFKPKCIGYFNSALGLAFDAAKVLCLFVILFLLLRKKKMPSPISWVLGALEGWICLITLINHGDFVQACALAVSVMGIVLLVDVYSDRMKELLGALMLNFEWSVYANLITVLKWPDEGIVWDAEYNVAIYFFGPDNWFMYLCIPAVCVALLYMRVQWSAGSKPLGVIRGLCLTAAAYACVFLQWPATAVVALAGFAVVMIIGLIPGVRYCVSYPVVFIGAIGANLAIAVFRVMETVPFIASFIENVLKKSTTLSGRTPLWDGFGELIDGRYFTGIGVPNEGYVVGRAFDHFHNIIFDMLIQGGMPALVLFFAVLVLVGITLTRLNKTPSARILTAAMAALLIICIPEVCRHGLVYLIFPLAWYVERLEEKCVLHAADDLSISEES